MVLSIRQDSALATRITDRLVLTQQGDCIESSNPGDKRRRAEGDGLACPVTLLKSFATKMGFLTGTLLSNTAKALSFSAGILVALAIVSPDW
jgi:hypothetical protein